MDEMTQKKFDEITKKEVAALTRPDREFLRARKSYLSPLQKDYYQEVLNSSEEEEEVETVSELKELKTKASKLGIDHKAKPKDEIRLAVDTVEGPAGAAKPE